MYQVIKRDGKISGFDIIKITDAIKKAIKIANKIVKSLKNVNCCLKL